MVAPPQTVGVDRAAQGGAGEMAMDTEPRSRDGQMPPFLKILSFHFRVAINRHRGYDSSRDYDSRPSLAGALRRAIVVSVVAVYYSRKQANIAEKTRADQQNREHEEADWACAETGQCLPDESHANVS